MLIETESGYNYLSFETDDLKHLLSVLEEIYGPFVSRFSIECKIQYKPFIQLSRDHTFTVALIDTPWIVDLYKEVYAIAVGSSYCKEFQITVYYEDNDSQTGCGTKTQYQ